MSKITLNNLADLNNASTAVASINENNSILVNAVENTLSLDGTAPNAMEAVLDMNSNRVINVGAPTGSQDAVRLTDLQNVNAPAADLAVAVGEAQTAAAAASSSATTASAAATDSDLSAAIATASASSATASATSASSSLATLLAAGIWNNTNTTVLSATSTILTSAMGNTIVLNGGSSFTTVFGSASVYPTGFIAQVRNADTLRGKTISTIDTSTVSHILYPGLDTFVYKTGTGVSSRWQATTQQRWNIPTTSITVYVDSSLGNDNNDGHAPGAGGALLTIQAAVKRIHNAYTLGESTPTIQLADGTYNVGAGVTINYPTGPTQIQITGNPGTPGNVIISCNAGGTCFTVQEPATVTLNGMTLSTIGNGSVGIFVRQFATCDISNIVFSNFPLGNMISLNNNASMNVIGANAVAGGAVSYAALVAHSFYTDTTFGAAVNGGLTFTDFFTAADCSVIQLGASYNDGAGGTGTTGQKFSADTNSIIHLGATIIPGATSGVATNGAHVLT